MLKVRKLKACIYLHFDDGEENWSYWQCKRTDGLDLIDEWKRRHSGGTFVDTRSDLLSFNSTGGPLFGLFSENHMPFEDQRDPETVPSLAEMTKAAIGALKGSPHGFFLMVEGARIDMGHHKNWALRALNETAAFDEAIRQAMAMVDIRETLVVVTADHSHNMIFTGYTGNKKRSPLTH